LALKLLKARHEAAGDLKRNPTTRTLLTSCLELLDLLATLLGEALALKVSKLRVRSASAQQPPYKQLAWSRPCS
jgi:hypothetical protein